MSRRVDYAALVERRCSICKETKSVAQFCKYDDPSAPITGWRYYSRCKTCNSVQCRDYGAAAKPKRNARLKAWRKNNPEKASNLDRRRSLKRNYGLSQADVEMMNQRQGGKCLLCGSAKPLVVDHCHSTGRVRGLLCTPCNTWLGRVEANPGMMERARIYLGANRPESEPATPNPTLPVR